MYMQKETVSADTTFINTDEKERHEENFAPGIYAQPERATRRYSAVVGISCGALRVGGAWDKGIVVVSSATVVRAAASSDPPARTRAADAALCGSWRDWLARTCGWRPRRTSGWQRGAGN